MIPFTFLFMGRSGCGKGTQSKLLQAYLKERYPEEEVRSLEVGAEIRKYMEGESYTQDLSRKVYGEGSLQPAFISIHLWAGLLIKLLTGKEHLVIDGVARELLQAEALDSALDFYKRDSRFVIYVRVSGEWSKERLMSRARADDTEENIENRLKWFDTHVVPAIEFFQHNPRYHFIEVDGEQTIEKVHQDIVTGIAQCH